ncbi:hypothetical protein KW439_00205 [Vibrio fluvialis]|nr:hypothetical protein [Vibrio fluvialis]
MKLSTITFYAPFLVILLCLILIGYNVVWRNFPIRDIILSFCALIGAFIIFFINIQSSMTSKDMDNTVLSYVVHRGNNISIHDMKDSSERLPFKFDIYNRERLTRYYGIQHSDNAKNMELEERYRIFDKIYDVAKTCFIGDLISNYPDWNMKDHPKSLGGGKSYRIDPIYSEGDTFLTAKQLIDYSGLNYPEDKLSLSLSEGVFLPPNTTVNSYRNGIVFENDYITIDVSFDILLNFEWNLKFRPNGEPYTIFNNSPHEYNVYSMYSKITTRYNKMFFNSKRSEPYKKWGDDLNKIFYHTFSSYSKEHRLYNV